jgi:DNA-binding GntR family transcriptional regulator
MNLPAGSLMVRDSVAVALREAIISGVLQPGGKVIENRWAKQLGVAQSSVRDAIGLLVAEGFLERHAGRSARVTLMSQEDIAQVYQLRAVLEGLSARLVAEKKPDLSDLEQLTADMRSALNRRNMRAFYERDLQFHLLICEKSGNRYLQDALRKLLVPLFSFVVIRARGEYTSPEVFEKTIEQHQQVVQAMQSGDPFFAEQQARSTIFKFHDDIRDLVAARTK